MPKTGVFAVALLLLVTFACAPKVDLEAERAALEQTQIEYSKAGAAKEIERLLTFYADDASVIPPNSPRLTGKEAISKFVSEMATTPGFAMSEQTIEAAVSSAGNLGYTLDLYELTINDPEGKPVTDRGQDLHIWKKQSDGTWKIVVDIWNSDLPLPGPPASE